ncbi:Vacuolar amino acid transporter 4 [Candida tropicalis]
MSEPQNIEQKKERRRSIALLTRSPLSHSPNPSPRNSLPNSYVNNSSFLRSDSYNNNNNDSAIMENYSDHSSSSEQRHSTPISNRDNLDLSNGIDNPELIKKIAKHLPTDFDSLNQEEPLISRDNFNPRGTATDRKAYFLLLKAFVGTGVLFLPKAFANGGLLFSIGLLAFFALLSWWCYTILVYTKMATRVSSFAEIGMKLYGPWLQRLILSSIVISQIGFVAAYIVFTSENLRAFVANITGWNPLDINIIWFIILQVLIVTPLSLIRDITKLSLSAVLANIFIFTGLFTILYFMIFQWLGVNNGKFGSGIVYYFNQSEFSLFIGTAIFAFEGIGLIIPIQESMIHPNNFPKVLGQVIFSITIIMVIVGGLGYLTFGDEVNTVILLNLPQDSPMVILTQLLYSLAILLSTPLQLFPAIRLLESKLIFGSGKSSPGIKWLKNLFRTVFVLFTAYIAFVGGQNLDKFVSFVGCFACIPLVYMYPPILHLKSCCKIHDGLSEKEKSTRYWLAVLDYILLIIGGVAFVYTTIQILFT